MPDRRRAHRRGPVAEADDGGVRGRPLDADRHAPQPQPRRRDARRQEGEHPHLPARRERLERAGVPAGLQREVHGERPEEPDGGPAAEPVGVLEQVVRPAAHRRRGAGADEQAEADEAAGEGERRDGDARRLADPRDRRDRGERAQPRRSRQRAAHVDAADVVHVGDAPADPQRPGPRAAAGEPEQQVEDALLADQDRRGEVHEHQGSERRQRAPVGDPPVAAAHVMREHAGVDHEHRDDQPVVRQEPGARPGRARWGHTAGRGHRRRAGRAGPGGAGRRWIGRGCTPPRTPARARHSPEMRRGGPGAASRAASACPARRYLIAS